MAVLATGKRVACVHGMGGVGKSTMAAAVVARVSSSYDDRIAWVRLAGLSRPQAKRIILEIALGRAPQHAELSGKGFAAALARQRMLIVLDNTDDLELVAPILAAKAKAGDVAILITTRDRGLPHRLGLPPTSAVPLGPLARADALEMLESLLGDAQLQHDAAPALLDTLGDLPLAIKLSAHLLADNPALTIESFRRLVEARLEVLATDTPDPEPRNHSVRASLEVSLATLSDAERGAFLALGAFRTSTFDMAAMSAVAAIPDAALVAGRLHRLCLIDAVDGSRWRLHELLGQLSRHLAGGELSTAELRMALHFRERCEALLLLNDSSRFRQGISPELRNLTESFRILESRLLSELGGDPSDLLLRAELPSATAAFDVMRLGVAVLLATKWFDLPDESRLLTSCVVAARSFGDRFSEGTFLNGLGLTFQKVEQFDKARALYRSAADKQIEAGRDGASPLNNLGTAFRAQGLYAEALACFRDAVARERARTPPSPRGIVVGLNNIGDTLVESGQVETAVPYLAEALAVATEQLGASSIDTATCCANLGRLLERTGNRAAAVKHMARALEIFQQELGERSPEVLILLSNMASAAHLLGRLDEARALFVRAYDVAQASGRLARIEGALLRVNYGMFLRDLGEVEEGLRELEAGHDLLAAQYGEAHPRILPIREQRDALRSAVASRPAG